MTLEEFLTHSSVISIHTPARGVTAGLCHSQRQSFHFDPHPREGGDYLSKLDRLCQEISIHTPARGVTDRFRRNGIV